MVKPGQDFQLEPVNLSGGRGMTLDRDDDHILSNITNSEEVAYIEADTKVYSTELMSQGNASWGFSRISSSRPGSLRGVTGSQYVFDSTAGAGVMAYVLDTGIRINHTEFGRRTRSATNTIDNVDDDEYGHGSHLAGTIDGKTHGVAKSVSLVSVKV
jgi:subtilisin family serine protease